MVSAKFPRRPALRGRFNCHSSLSTDRDSEADASVNTGQQSRPLIDRKIRRDWEISRDHKHRRMSLKACSTTLAILRRLDLTRNSLILCGDFLHMRKGPSHYGSEMPIAAFSPGDASQYSYLCAALKSCCISFGVGGAGGLRGSNGRASSRKKL